MFFRKSNNEEKDLPETLESFKKGSAQAFGILYKKYGDRIYRFCLRMLGDEAQAKDAFQETFVKVYENSKKFYGENFTSWVFTIARHTCLNMIRSKKDVESYDDYHHGQTVEMKEDIGLQKSLQDAIASLPAILKEALLLREYEGYSYQEIADILDIDLSLAKVRVHRARVQLRKILKPIVKEINESR